MSEPHKPKGKGAKKGAREQVPIYPAVTTSGESALRETAEKSGKELEAFYSAEEADFVNRIARSAAESIAKQK